MKQKKDHKMKGLDDLPDSVSGLGDNGTIITSVPCKNLMHVQGVEHERLQAVFEPKLKGDFNIRIDVG